MNWKLSFILLSVLMLSACKEDTRILSQDEEARTAEERAEFYQTSEQDHYVKGKINVYVSEDTYERLSISPVGSIAMHSVATPMQATLARLKATSITRVFPPAGEFEERTRRAGLHRWLSVTFDESTSSSQACQMMSSLPDIEYAEPEYVIAYPTAKPRPIDDATLRSLTSSATSTFSDPLLEDQWHYHNIGKQDFAKEGADINLFSAWELETGKSNVIVAIVDGGIDTEHEDLVDNLYVNEAEKNGQPGVDDDNNGYVDDIHGFNFITNNGTIYPDANSHGTHVAGTVAARNNNGIGVCGVAGGDGTPDSGVRLLSCQIFGHRGDDQANTVAAIKYGADMGAVISQNSWGYRYPTSGATPKVLRDAIDYFIDNAGCDKDGNQRPDAPMKGGVVIFAAGNDDVDFMAIPASYSRVVSVAAMAPNYKKAGYSTRGNWVTITAPGGDLDYELKAGVLSTVAPNVDGMNGRKYGYMDGTSMACPHVSGIAALMLSRFGGQGYTNAQLLSQIKSAIKDIDINENNPDYVGKLGVGYIDAYRALTNKNLNKAPQAPQFDIRRSTKASVDYLKLYWVVPYDEDDQAPIHYHLYMSTVPLSPSNYQQKGQPVGPGDAKYISAVGKRAGDEISHLIKNLKPETSYYFALVAIDRWGLTSEPTFLTVTTLPNTPPQVKGVPAQPIRLNSSLAQSIQFDLTVTDPDGHVWKMAKPEYMKGVRLKTNLEEGKITVYINSILPEGKYEYSLTFIDQLGDETTVVIPFEIYEIQPPRLLRPITTQTAGLQQGTLDFDLEKIFEGDKEATLTYTASSSDAVVVSTKITDQKLIVSPHKPGRATVTVKVKDNINNSVSTTFDVFVVEDKTKPVYSVFPIPVVTDLNIWLNSELDSATAVLTTMRGEEVLRKTVRPDAEGIAKLSMKKFAPGSYTLTVRSAKGVFTKTILKQ